MCVFLSTSARCSSGPVTHECVSFFPRQHVAPLAQSHMNVCLSFHVSTLLLWFASACLCVCLADFLQSSRIKRSAVQLYHINTHGNTHMRTCLPPCSTGGAGGRHPAVPHTAQPRAAPGSGAAQGATHSHHLLTGLLLGTLRAAACAPAGCTWLRLQLVTPLPTHILRTLCLLLTTIHQREARVATLRVPSVPCLRINAPPCPHVALFFNAARRALCCHEAADRGVLPGKRACGKLTVR
jgi:hypothetical protein